MPLRGRPMIAHTIERLGKHARIEAVVVVLSPYDRWWRTVQPSTAGPVYIATGGTGRCHSVLNGLRALAERAGPADRVLVHDAARPCLRSTDIDRLLETVGDCDEGGLLGLRVRDTMTRTGDDAVIQSTVERSHLWHALTPQVFPIATLTRALQNAVDADVLVTDESQAVERLGVRPRMVEGYADNIKITLSEDIEFAELYLSRQDGLQ